MVRCLLTSAFRLPPRLAKTLCHTPLPAQAVPRQVHTDAWGMTGTRACVHSQHLQGYKAQSALVMERLSSFIAGAEARRESIVVEGVHLAPNAVVRLMERHASIVPFLIYIRWDTHPIHLHPMP